MAMKQDSKEKSYQTIRRYLKYTTDKMTKPQTNLTCEMLRYDRNRNQWIPQSILGMYGSL